MDLGPPIIGRNGSSWDFSGGIWVAAPYTTYDWANLDILNDLYKRRKLEKEYLKPTLEKRKPNPLPTNP
jgi:hypothetical protein